jgi:hypothetical protein
MLRENDQLFPTVREPVRSPTPGGRLNWPWASGATKHKTSEELAAFSRCCFRNPCGSFSILRTRSAQVRRLGGGRNAEIFERNEPRDENRRANLLYRSSIAQVPPPRSTPQSESAESCFVGKFSLPSPRSRQERKGFFLFFLRALRGLAVWLSIAVIKLSLWRRSRFRPIVLS